MRQRGFPTPLAGCGHRAKFCPVTDPRSCPWQVAIWCQQALGLQGVSSAVLCQQTGQVQVPTQGTPSLCWGTGSRTPPRCCRATRGGPWQSALSCQLPTRPPKALARSSRESLRGETLGPWEAQEDCGNGRRALPWRWSRRGALQSPDPALGTLLPGRMGPGSCTPHPQLPPARGRFISRLKSQSHPGGPAGTPTPRRLGGRVAPILPSWR